MKRLEPKSKCVYIAPLKSLARERLKEWRRKLGSPPFNWKVLELSGDTHHDEKTLKNADILVCTPEKWDLISRGWRGSEEFSAKAFVKEVRLLVIDEIHLLGEGMLHIVVKICFCFFFLICLLLIVNLIHYYFTE